MFASLQLSEERAKFVIDEITTGSDTHWRFYALLICASMIACFGLAANSTAVIIGAMLVSPLMMPIYGVALGMLQGNPRLLWQAALAELAGIILAIASAYVVGLADWTAGEATAEMLSRTQPNLIDLLVAIFAGLAGSYALVDERISPALPGVAIATAIVPPLSTCGLCLALGAWQGAAGSLLLFLANFVSILLVSLLVFFVTNLAEPKHVKTFRGFIRHFGPTVVVFVVVTVILTDSLTHITADRRTKTAIHDVLVAELASDRASDLEDFIHNRVRGRIQILATVRSPRVLAPARVTAMQTTLESTLDRPVDLVVRTVLAKDVSALGSQLAVSRMDLDGSFLTEGTTDDQSREDLAEQVIRENFQDEPGFSLTKVEYGVGSRQQGMVVAYMDSMRRLAPDEIRFIQHKLRERFEDPLLDFYAQVNTTQLEHSDGPVRIEWTSHRNASEEELSRLPGYDQEIRNSITERTRALPLFVHFNFQTEPPHALVEVVGPEAITPEQVEQITTDVVKAIRTELTLSLWYRNQYVVGTDGYTTYDELTADELGTRTQILRELFHSTVSDEVILLNSIDKQTDTALTDASE